MIPSTCFWQVVYLKGTNKIAGIFFMSGYQWAELSNFGDILIFDCKRSGICTLEWPKPIVTIIDQEGKLHDTCTGMVCVEDYDMWVIFVQYSRSEKYGVCETFCFVFYVHIWLQVWGTVHIFGWTSAISTRKQQDKCFRWPFSSRWQDCSLLSSFLPSRRCFSYGEYKLRETLSCERGPSHETFGLENGKNIWRASILSVFGQFTDSVPNLLLQVNLNKLLQCTSSFWNTN